MILYHGTNIDFDRTDIGKTKKYKDFGQGFYLTDIKTQAEELAEKKNAHVRRDSCRSRIRI